MRLFCQLLTDMFSKDHFRKGIILAALLLLGPYAGTTLAQTPNITVAKYLDGKRCAISYTFDDGLYDQYTIGAPALEERGFRGTFFINAGKVDGEGPKPDPSRMNWLQIEDLSRRGHEISNHGWRHRNFAKTDFETLKADIDMGDSAIMIHTGKRPLTFAYPGNVKEGPGMEYVAQGRVATRMKQRSAGKKNEGTLHNWLEKTIKDGDWQVGMTHGLVEGYDAFIDPSPLFEHLDEVRSRSEHEVWVGTFTEVASYIQERDNISLQIESADDTVTIKHSLSLDARLFTSLLTLCIEAKKIRNATQGSKTLTPVHKDNMTYINFDPFGPPVTIIL